MKTFYVSYVAGASFAIEVQAEDEESARAAANEKFAEVAPGPLCHQCSGDYDLGDFEEGEVWEA